MSAPTHEPGMSLRLLRPFLSICEPHLAAGGRFEGTRLDYGDTDTRVPHSVVLSLMEPAVELTGDPALALHAAAHLRRGDLDLIEYVARASKTVGAAIESINRYLRLMHDAAEFSLQVEGDEAAWEVAVADYLEWPVYAAEYTTGLLKVALAEITGGRVTPTRVQFMHAAPPYVDAYTELFGCPVDFEGDRDVLMYPAEAMELKPDAADPGLKEVLVRQAEQAMRSMRAPQNYADRVREVIEKAIGEGEFGPETVAHKLAVSTRTLRRRLQEEGTSYAEQLDEVRKARALAHLTARDLAISEIAFLLGFARISSFYRAFRRWTGTTPGDFRRDPVAR